ncbi:MAG: hypothetical protein Q9162_003399 [Coniocarpon cinnabarinum]
MTMLFSSDFTSIDIPVSPSITIHGVKGGTGPPLLLLHGFPQTKDIWHKVATPLSKQYTIVALDLRGYGGSSKPQAPKENMADHSLYSKSAVAADMVAAMKYLGFERFFLVGHDRGARTAHALATHHPAAVEKLLLLDIIPTLAHYSTTTSTFATAYWHWFFLIQPSPFPEMAIISAPDTFAEQQMGAARLGGGRDIFDPEAWKIYAAQFRDREGVHAMCEDYRAASTVDCEEQKRDREQGRKIRCETRVLWGKYGVIEKLYDAVKEWGEVVEEGKLDVKGCRAVEAGHYIPEERPEDLVEEIRSWMV